jgi:hypothetical protein
MDARFEGIADPEHVRVQPENGEYMIKLTKYDFIYHAHVKIGEADPIALHQQQTRAVRFLVDKLIADLATPEKILVFRQNEEVSANDLLDFRRALADYGPSTLLWVQPARQGHPPGTVVVVDPTLIIGYVTRLSPRQNATDFDLRSWLTVLRNAHRVRPGRTPVTQVPAARRLSMPSARTDTIFGKDGNAAAVTGAGWSAPETGFTWSIDDNSELTITKPGDAETYRLEMDVVPFVAPPAVMAQRLDVTVNGELIQTFDPLPRGRVACLVPGRLLERSDTVEIKLNHPAAARPSAVAGQNDDRRLAVAFHTLSLICV